MQVEVVVAMERRPVTVHGHDGSLIGWFQRGRVPREQPEARRARRVRGRHGR